MPVGVLLYLGRFCVVECWFCGVLVLVFLLRFDVLVRCGASGASGVLALCRYVLTTFLVYKLFCVEASPCQGFCV